MSQKNCGPCGGNSDPSESSDYLIVKATASAANSCGDPAATPNEITNCPIQEPTYDISRSSFVLPVEDQSISMKVCNAAPYTVGQYIQFVASGIIMLVSGVDTISNLLTLTNGCDNGASIPTNQNAGYIINNNSPFVIAGRPPCLTEEETDEEFQKQLEQATKLCMPNMAVESESARMQITGRTESDPDNLDFEKCIKRVPNLYYENGGHVTPSIERDVESSHNEYRRLGIHNSTGQQVKLRSIVDYNFGGSGLTSGFKYLLVGNESTFEVPVGPAYITSLFAKLIEEKGVVSDYNTYTSIGTGDTYSKDFAVGFTEVNNLKNKNLQNHWYLNVHLIVSVQGATGGSPRQLQIKLNDQLVGVITAGTSGFVDAQVITIPVKILTADTTFNLKLVANGGGMKYYYRIAAIGAEI